MSDAMTQATVCDYCWKELPPHMDACGSGDAIKCLRERAEAAEALLTETRTKALSEKEAENARLREALKGMLDEYCALVESGDAGFWNPEDVDAVQAARAALKAEGGEI